MGVLLCTLILPSRYVFAGQPGGPATVATTPAQAAVAQPIVKNSAQTPHVLPAPARPGPEVKDPWNVLAKRVPNEKGLYKSAVSLRALDLKKIPSEADLRMAGQMGSPLTPTAAAEPTKITDPVKRKKQEGDNMLFGEAIQKWNQHDYNGAVALFAKHRMTYPDSPWAGEAELHLGCQAQFSGSWEEARTHFEQVLSATPKGSDMYQKVKLRRAVLHMDQGQLDEASKAFTEMLQTETDWQRRTYAQRWILDLSHYKADQVALRTCGTNSIAYVLRSEGKDEAADNLGKVATPGEQGYSLRGLTELANKAGLSAVAVRADGTDDLEKLPTPFIAHYRDQHFVVVRGLAENGDVRLYDPRLEHDTQLSAEAFREQWSELALLFQSKPEGIQFASDGDLDEQMGGCCGIPRYPNGLGGCPDCCGMPGYIVNPVSLNLCVQDIPMWHKNQFGPDVKIQLTYNSQDSLVQMRPVGNKWVLNYASYAMESPSQGGSGTVLVVMPDGRGDIYQPPSSSGGSYTPPVGVFNKLNKTGAYAFNVTLPDGTIYYYSVPLEMSNGSYSSLLTSIADRYGNTVTISHNTDGSLNQVTDPLGNQWTFFYNANGYVDHVTDGFGRQATFSYDGSGNLTGQTDMGGLSYGYTYDANVDLLSIIKPSGTTKFLVEPSQDGTQGTKDLPNGSNEYPGYGGPMWACYRVTVTDPQGYAQEYYYDGYYHYGWYRDQNQFQSALPALQAPKTRYDYALQNAIGVVSKITYADGNYVQYSYNNSALQQPTQITRSVASGVTETVNLTYNPQGQVTALQDARTNTTNYQYVQNGSLWTNGFDLVKVTDPLNHTTLTLGYDSSRNVSSVMDATGNITQATYNALGQITNVTNAAQHGFDANYNPSNQLTSISQGQGQSKVTLRTLSYDSVGRLQSDTDADGHMLIYEYDGLDRVTKVLYPDGTFVQNNYSCCWLESQTDRLGRTTYYTRDFRGRPVEVQDANNNLTQILYDPAGNLVELYDGNDHVTQWTYDARNRISNKIYADGSTYTYVYDGAGNLTARTDARNITVNYTYNPNNNLTGITAPGLTPTTYSYDERNWTKQMTDGIGTTAYGYDLAGRVNSISGPLDNDSISLLYDSMGRVSSQTVNGQTSTYSYNDNLERLTSSTSPIGSFGYSYRTAISPQLAAVSYPNGQSTSYSYDNSKGDTRLSQITNLGSGSSGLFSQFGYQYDAAKQITQWTQQAGSGDPMAYQLQYDATGQLTGASVQDTATATVTQTYGYGYDNAGNRTAEQNGAALSQDAYNNLNELTGRQGSGTGTMPFRGAVNKPATVSINGSPVAVSPAGSFAATVNVAPGNNTVTVSATDQNNDTASHTYQVAVAASNDNRTLGYDANGNLLSATTAGVTTTYEWDALNRLTAINQGSGRSEFSYDGANHRCQIIEKNNGSVRDTQHFTWMGMGLAERRDISNNVTTRFSGFGEQIGDQNYFYTRDHLGSIRELTDKNQMVCARYSYDPYGVRSANLITGSNAMEADFGFAGHYVHLPSGLHLAPFRAYAASLGRWLSRDPIEEKGGLNLYGYVRGSPVNSIDPLGADTMDLADQMLALYNADPNVPALGLATAVGAAQALNEAGQKYCENGGAAGLAKDAAMAAVALVPGGIEVEEAAEGGAVAFRTFDELKGFLGSPGEGNVWHHIVEQSQIEKFGAAAIHNADNVIAISSELNSELNAFYQTFNTALGGLSPRQWLSNLEGPTALQQSYDFGRWALHYVGSGLWR